MVSIEVGFSSKQAVRTVRFWLIGSILFCIYFAIMVVIVHIAPYVINIGIPVILAASVVSIIAMSSVAGMFFIGFISDRTGPRLSLTACLIVLTLALIWLLFAREVWMLYLFAVIFGFAYGGIDPTFMLIAAEAFGLVSLGITAGILNFSVNIGGAVGPLLAGSIFDVTASYHLAFVICVILSALATFMSLFLLKTDG